MTFGDYSPRASPSLEQQRDTLQKGLGRARQWAVQRQLDDELLLEACLQDRRFDMQVDGPRGDWLWQLIQAASAAERFRVPILHAVYDLSDSRSAQQLCRLAWRYAEMGDETFRTQLYEIVERKPVADSPWRGEEEILALDGEQAFLFAARVRGKSLATRSWEWDDRSLVDLAVERFGKEYVGKLLETSSDEAIRRFRQSWQREMQRNAEKSQSPSHRERMTAVPVLEVIAAAEGETRCFPLRGWGMYANEADLQAVLQRLWAEREPRVIANLLRVFAARALPEFDSRLIDLCQHGHMDVRRQAFMALKENGHPLVRQFALSELQKGVRDALVVGLFIRNYQAGDEHRILEAIEFPDDVDELHWLLMDVIKILENNPTADCFSLGILSYASTPCETCRFYAVRLLVNQQVAPQWLQEECRYDSAEDCRELIAKRIGLTEGG